MQHLDELLSHIRRLSATDIQRLHEEVTLIRAAIPQEEAQSMEDIAPLDTPIEGLKDEKTGRLKIRFPFYYGVRAEIGWRTLTVTTAAQRELIQIFAASLQDDEASGRNRATKPNLQ